MSEYLSDEPIKSPKDDILGRSGFSRELAKSMLTIHFEESFVIGLYGKWGSGKSSILSMVRTYLEESRSAGRHIVVDFDPWQFSGQEHLILMFFQQLLSSLGKRPHAQAFRDVGNKLRTYAKYLTPLEIVPPISAAVSAVRTTTEALGDAYSATAQLLDKDLVKLRREIDNTLRKLDIKIVITIDDIDRLTPDEIRQIFQLVKLGANFPHTVYLLAFDKGVVAKALEYREIVSSGYGSSYLDKIVQVSYDIPQIEQDRLWAFLTDKLSNKLSHVCPREKRRFDRIFNSHIKTLFVTLRDAKRFINGLSFNIGLVIDDVNTVDFTSLEVIRLFAPDAYHAIAKSKPSLAFLSVGQDVSAFFEDVRTKFESIIALVDEEKRAYVRGICHELFPQLAAAYRKDSEFVLKSEAIFPSSAPQWLKDLRICHAEVFDRYFVIDVP